jgi:cell division protein ZipA
MPELRIILLVAGVLFIAGIAAFEWWRSRGARAYRATEREPSSGDLRSSPHSTPKSLPEIDTAREPRSAVPDTLPVIELGYAEKTGARDSGGISLSGDVAVDRPQEKDQSEAEENTSTQAILRAHDGPYIGQDDEISEVRVFDEQPIEGPKLVLAWPSDAERRIVTLRVIPLREPRFLGRALRQAFAACGFWHGPLDIYHLPDRSGRVILSAAALAQPGTFDPSIMDSQRFSGVNLFAVLPGPLDERETFDQLVHAARSLAERLEASITDQHGEELTAARVARLRQSLEAPMAAQAAGES